MKTALIMGINGGFGGYVAKALMRQGWKIKALMRDESTLLPVFVGTETIQGDASNIEDVRKAADNVELIVYGINPVNYDWVNKALPWLDVTATVAEEKGLNIIFPGNVYVFNPVHGPGFDENSIISPVTSKGEIRCALEERLNVASKHGAKVIIIRCGDFLGKHAHSAWIHHLVKSGKQQIKLLTTGPASLTHSYAYLPDVARSVAELASKFDVLPAFNIFHFKGNQFNFNDLATTMSKVTGKKVVIKNFPWFAIKVMSLYSKMYSGILEMRYLWNVEINLEDKKLNEVLGHDCVITPLSDVLIECGVIKRHRTK